MSVNRITASYHSPSPITGANAAFGKIEPNPPVIAPRLSVQSPTRADTAPLRFGADTAPLPLRLSPGADGSFSGLRFTRSDRPNNAPRTAVLPGGPEFLNLPRLIEANGAKPAAGPAQSVSFAAASPANERLSAHLSGLPSGQVSYRF